MVAHAIPSYPLKERLLQARVALAHHLGMPLDSVHVDIGAPDKKNGFAEQVRPFGTSKQYEQLTIKIDREGANVLPEITAATRARLGTLPPLNAVAQMETTEHMALKLVRDLDEATKGTNFNPLLRQWKGFKPEVIEAGHQIPDFGGLVEDGPYGAKARIHFAHAKGEDASKEAHAYAETVKNRIPEEKEILLYQLNKYIQRNHTPTLSDEETKQITEQAKAQNKDVMAELQSALNIKMAAAQPQIDALKAKAAQDVARLVVTADVDHNEVLVTFRSPEQIAAYEKADPATRDKRFRDAFPGEDELRNSNPLTSRLIGLTTEEISATEHSPIKKSQLATTVMRPLFYNKDKEIIKEALPAFGRRDIQSALITEMIKRIKPTLAAHPERAEQVHKIINSNLFKDHSRWHAKPGTVGAAKPEPAISTTSNGVSFTFDLKLDEYPMYNQLLQVLEGLANPAQAKNPLEDMIKNAIQTAQTTPLANAAVPSGVAQVLANGPKAPIEHAESAKTAGASRA